MPFSDDEYIAIRDNPYSRENSLELYGIEWYTCLCMVCMAYGAVHAVWYR